MTTYSVIIIRPGQDDETLVSGITHGDAERTARGAQWAMDRTENVGTARVQPDEVKKRPAPHR